MALKLSVITKDPSGVVFAAAYGEATARDFATPEFTLIGYLFTCVRTGAWQGLV